MALTKVTEVSLLALTNVSSNSFSVGSSVDVSTYYQGDVRIRMGRTSATGFTVAPHFRLQKTYKTSPGVYDWVTEVDFTPALGSSIGSQAITTGNSASASLTVGAVTNFAAGDFCFIQNTTLGNSEFVRVTTAASTTITLVENLLNSQSSTGTIRNQAEEFTWVIDLLGVQKIRLLADASGAGQTVAVEAVIGAQTAL